MSGIPMKRRPRLRHDIPLEQQLQGELRRARAADLIQRIEAAILAAASERRTQHLGRLAEEGGKTCSWSADRS